MVLSLNDGNAKEQILFQLNEFFAQKIDSLKKKGLLMPQFYILVLGLPNVGKSSLINACSDYGSRTIVQNKPGVTKRKQLIKISDNFFLYDTPGIMIKKLDQDVQGYILALLNIIKKDVVPLDDVCMWAFNFYMDKYKNEFVKFFQIPTYINFADFIEYLCRRYRFYKTDNIHDKERAKDYFLGLAKDGKICKVNYEKN
jgi:ribosome biogenesis GTPase A